MRRLKIQILITWLFLRIHNSAHHYTGTAERMEWLSPLRYWSLGSRADLQHLQSFTNPKHSNIKSSNPTIRIPKYISKRHSLSNDQSCPLQHCSKSPARSWHSPPSVTPKWRSQLSTPVCEQLLVVPRRFRVK